MVMPTHRKAAMTDAAPALPERGGRWADLPHELLVRVFAAQPEPLHNLGAEHTCRACARAVRNLPFKASWRALQ